MFHSKILKYSFVFSTNNIICSSPSIVFYRFLSLLLSHDWSHDPLVVNLNDELTGKLYALYQHLIHYHIT